MRVVHAGFAWFSALAEGEQRLAPMVKTLALVTQSIGRTGPIDLAQGVVLVSVRSGMRRLACGWAGSFLIGVLVAAYSFWRK